VNVSRCLAVAASPSFALMALGSRFQNADPAATLCSVAGVAPLGGMAAIYALMSLFHAPPRLRMIEAWYQQSVQKHPQPIQPPRS
jgi:hypothetical protein